MHHNNAFKHLFAELKRRRVFRAVALYGAAVFALLQIADGVFPALGLPEVGITWLVAMGLAGLPVVVFVAWTFDLTAYGFHRTPAPRSGEIEAILALPRGQRWLPGMLGLLGLVLLMFGSCWGGTRMRGEKGVASRRRIAAAPMRSIAVMPFLDINEPTDHEFSDGLAEELRNTLFRIEGVRVVARTSAFAFEGRDVDVRTIGRILRVGSVVEGSVRRSGRTIRVSVQISRTSDGFVVWSRTWERKLTTANVFEIQDAITTDIARLLGGDVKPVSVTGPVQPITDCDALGSYCLPVTANGAKCAPGSFARTQTGPARIKAS